jgi:REP element-mobilizing transposase RayT
MGMARQLRIEYEGAIYHIMSRGDRQEAIFEDDEDRGRFLLTLAQACEKAEWHVHAYCLMRNHFHLVLETPKPTLVAGMKWFLGTYTQRYNARHRVWGHLFSGRYKSLLVDGSNDSYLRTVCDYVHLNPVRAGLIGKGMGLESFPWSSYGEYLKPLRARKAWVRVDRLLGELGWQDNALGRREFARYMAGRVLQEEDGENDEAKSIRRGWRLGAEDFLERLQKTVDLTARRGIHHADEVNVTMKVKANRIITEELKRRKLRLQQLGKMKKMHKTKAQIGQRLRRETTMTLAWIAERLHAGRPGTLANAIGQLK